MDHTLLRPETMGRAFGENRHPIGADRDDFAPPGVRIRPEGHDVTDGGNFGQAAHMRHVVGDLQYPPCVTHGPQRFHFRQQVVEASHGRSPFMENPF
jgi:hypothetical protein